MSGVIAALALWFQITPPFGTYDSGSSVRGSAVRTITFNRKAVDSIVRDWLNCRGSSVFPGIPVDHEHSLANHGYDFDDVVAWIKDLRVEEDGSIWGELVFSEGWEKAYRLKEFPHFISPVLATRVEGANGHPSHVPTRLISAAFTKTPRLPLRSEPRVQESVKRTSAQEGQDVRSQEH